MKQLSGLDASFLYMETPTSFGHVSSLSVYDRPSPDFRPYEAFRRHLEARLPELEPFRRRLVEVPFELDHPWWVEDPDFDLDFHVRHIAVPPPGSDRELAELVARSIGRPLDRSRPLWEAYVIEGLADDRWAVLLKLHHATIDGAAGAELLTMLLDQQPSEAEPPSAPPPTGEPVPTPGELLGRTFLNFAARPQRLLRAQLRAMEDTAAILGSRREELRAAMARSMALAPGPPKPDEPALPTGPAPVTPFNRAITAHRRYAFRTTGLDDVKAIKNRFGVTVNDVVMSVCAGALRRYLQRHDALPDRPLVAGVPVSIRTGREDERWTNRVSSIFASLPTHLADRGERLAYTNKAMLEAKASFDLVPADALQDFSRFSPPAVFTQAAATMTRLKIADRVNPPINLIISNVPGPRQPLYLGPARLVHYYPVSTIAEGQGLNITVQSYEDRLDFGLVACRELVPDVDDLMDLIVDELAELLTLAGPAADAPDRARATKAETARTEPAEPGEARSAKARSAKARKAGSAKASKAGSAKARKAGSAKASKAGSAKASKAGSAKAREAKAPKTSTPKASSSEG